MSRLVAVLVAVSGLVAGCASHEDRIRPVSDIDIHESADSSERSSGQNAGVIAGSVNQSSGSNYSGDDRGGVSKISASPAGQDAGKVPLGTKVAIGRAVIGVAIFVGVTCAFVAC